MKKTVCMALLAILTLSTMSFAHFSPIPLNEDVQNAIDHVVFEDATLKNLEKQIQRLEDLDIEVDQGAYDLALHIIELKNKGYTDETIYKIVDAQKSSTWYKLTAAEKRLVLLDPIGAVTVNSCRHAANSTTIKYFGISGSGDASDVFRHAYWNTRMAATMSVGAAKMWANAHEYLSDKYMNTVLACGYTGRAHTNMDLYSNQIGRDIIQNYGISAPCESMIIDKINSGSIVLLHDNYNCNPTGIQ